MPDLLRTSAENTDFARVIDVARLPERQDFVFDIAPESREAEAIARLMGARSVRKLRFAGTLSPETPGGWRLEGQLGATVVQTCVVTLDPVTTRVDVPVRRSFRPVRGAQAADLVLSPEEDDEIEPLGRRIDLGLVAIETLALALPAYPRQEGAELEHTTSAAPGSAPLDATGPRPFAALESLKRKLTDES
jgi:uncharacterized metal-binding protein YceD (DUF177 family)